MSRIGEYVDPQRIREQNGIPELKPATVTLATGTLTDDEIERIARRVAELIQGRNYQGTITVTPRR